MKKLHKICCITKVKIWINENKVFRIPNQIKFQHLILFYQKFLTLPNEVKKLANVYFQLFNIIIFTELKSFNLSFTRVKFEMLDLRQLYII